MVELDKRSLRVSDKVNGYDLANLQFCDSGKLGHFRSLTDGHLNVLCKEKCTSLETPQIVNSSNSNPTLSLSLSRNYSLISPCSFKDYFNILFRFHGPIFDSFRPKITWRFDPTGGKTNQPR